MALNFGLLNTNAPAEIANSVSQGQQMAQQEKLGQMRVEATQLDLDKVKREAAGLQRMQQLFMENGKSPDLRSNFAEMIKSGIPHFMDIGFNGLKALEEQDRYQEFVKKGQPTGAVPAPAAPAEPSIMRQPAAAPTQNALGTGTYGMGTAPVNAMAAPAPAATPTPVNAMVAPNRTAQIQQEMAELSQFPNTPAAKVRMKVLEKELESAFKPHVVAGNLVGPNGNVIFAADKKSDFERELASSNLSEPEKQVLRRQWLNKQATHAPATTVNVSTEKAYGGAFGGKLADVDINKMTTAEKAPQLAESANRIIGLVQQGDVFTGPAADIKLNLARALNVAGASNQEKIANTESLIAATGQSTLDAIKGAGLGTGQGFTDKDLKFLQGVAGGTIGLTQKTLTELATLQHRAATRSAEAWNKRVGEMPKEVVQGTGLSTAPIKVPPLASAAPAARPAGVGPNWTLERDAAGNTAWVSPDRKSFKEAK